MAVKKKGMRKVNFGGRQYLWYSSDSKARVPDGGFVEQRLERILHIISSNKKFIVHYHIPQADDPHGLLRIEGPQFPRSPGAKTVQVPRWRHDGKRYPTADFVRRLIQWCMEA